MEISSQVSPVYYGFSMNFTRSGRGLAGGGYILSVAVLKMRLAISARIMINSEAHKHSVVSQIE